MQTKQLNKRRFLSLSSLALSSLLANKLSLASELTPASETGSAQEQKKSAKKEELEVIEVSGRRNQANTEVTETTKKLFNVPSVANDPLSAVFTMPGIVYADGDDGGEPAIRGSSPDDNAFYIDNMPANYIFHLFGDSIFNENVISDFALHPASFGAQYGNATGGIIDVKLRDPRNQEWKTTLEASMLKAGFMVEGGVTEDQAFYFSYRRSLVHLFLTEGEEEDGETISLQPISDDYQGKYQWLIGDNQKLTFSVTGASDDGALTISREAEEARLNPDAVGESSLNNRFDQQTLSWQYFADDASSFSVALGHMTESQKQKFGQGQFINLDTRRLNLRSKYTYHWLDNQKMDIGLDIQHSDSDYSYDQIPYFCTDHDADCEDRRGERVQDKDKLTRLDTALYIDNLWRLSDQLDLSLGVRAETDDYTKQTFVHPRAALTWYPLDRFSVIAKYGTYSRFPDIDKALKKLGNPNLKSPKAKHYTLAFSYDFDDVWNTQIDFYYKDLEDMALSLEDVNSNAALYYSNDLSGSAKGVEWVVNRGLHNDWYGWASVSWSNSDRTNDITQVTTEYYLDTPLLANVVAHYQLSEAWDVGMKLSVRSGAKYTPIISLRDNPNHPGFFLPNYGELNSKTLPTYYRLDLTANYKTQLFGLDSEVTFAIINATNNDNVSGYSYSPNEGDNYNNFSITKDTGMEMFPSIGLKVHF